MCGLTRLFSLFQSITNVKANCVLVYQRHIYGCGYGVCSNVRLSVNSFLKAVSQQADWVGLWRRWECESGWDFLVNFVVFLLDARSECFSQRRADCVVNSNLVRRRLLSNCWLCRRWLGQAFVKLTRILRLMEILSVSNSFLFSFRLAIEKFFFVKVGGEKTQRQMIESMLLRHRSDHRQNPLGTKAKSADDFNTYIPIVVVRILHLHELLSALDLVERHALCWSSRLADALRVSLSLRLAFLVTRRWHKGSLMREQVISMLKKQKLLVNGCKSEEESSVLGSCVDEILMD